MRYRGRIRGLGQYPVLNHTVQQSDPNPFPVGAADATMSSSGRRGSIMSGFTIGDGAIASAGVVVPNRPGRSIGRRPGQTLEVGSARQCRGNLHILRSGRLPGRIARPAEQRRPRLPTLAIAVRSGRLRQPAKLSARRVAQAKTCDGPSKKFTVGGRRHRWKTWGNL